MRKIMEEKKMRKKEEKMMEKNEKKGAKEMK